MAGKRYSTEQIIVKLREAEIEAGRLRRIGATLQEGESSRGEDIRHRREDCYLLDG